MPRTTFELARQRYIRGGRLDMQALAAEAGISRPTLYRWLGTREQLLGEVMWSFAQPALRDAIARADAKGLTGAGRVITAITAFYEAVLATPVVRRLLTDEPESLLRIVTSKHGVVQRRVIDAYAALLQQEIDAGHLAVPDSLTVRDLAYVITRVGESFLYAEAIVGEQPDIGKAAQALQLILR